MPSIIRPVFVDGSISFDTECTLIPACCSDFTVFSTSISERPNRSMRQTTTVSPSTAYSKAAGSLPAGSRRPSFPMSRQRKYLDTARPVSSTHRSATARAAQRYSPACTASASSRLFAPETPKTSLETFSPIRRVSETNHIRAVGELCGLFAGGDPCFINLYLYETPVETTFDGVNRKVRNPRTTRRSPLGELLDIAMNTISLLARVLGAPRTPTDKGSIHTE